MNWNREMPKVPLTLSVIMFMTDTSFPCLLFICLRIWLQMSTVRQLQLYPGAESKSSNVCEKKSLMTKGRNDHISVWTILVSFFINNKKDVEMFCF